MVVALLVATVIGWPIGSRAALAHEFRVALVTATAGTVNGRDVRDGFRLAVDQSPDVSHAPGTEAGDHLGGVDVDISLIDGTHPAAAASALEQQLTAGVTVVVVIAPASTTRAVIAETEGSPALLLVGEATGASQSPVGSALRLSQKDGWASTTSDADRFVAQFESAYGRAPSSAVALGYDAGRLLDAAAGAADGVEDLRSVVAAAAGNADVLVSSALTEVPTKPSGPDMASSPEARGSPRSSELLLLGTAMGVVLAVFGARRVLSRRSRRTAANS